MADNSRNNPLEKCCLKYFKGIGCPFGVHCQYLHKTRFEIDPIGYLRGDDFFVGSIPPSPRICRYYSLGRCMYENNCHYLHDNEHRARVNQNNVPASTVTTMSPNMPSTSRQGSNDPASTTNPDNNSAACVAVNNGNSSTQKAAKRIKDSNQNQIAETISSASPLSTVNWADAPEFFPKSKPRSYAEALGPEKSPQKKLCPYTNKDGVCMNVNTCHFLHGEICDMCGRALLHPFDEGQRKKHRQECLKQHEKNMELSFAIARSKEKSCGVCFEVIMEKTNGEQRFGILPNCNHCFCLTCIRKWRQARQFENKIIRACPECRVTSDFVCPSMYWVDTKEDKDKLINNYKKVLSEKDCKYFKKGEGKCPFGNKCFYLHQSPEGVRVDVGPPTRQRRRVDTEMDVLQVMLWDFLDERGFPWHSLADELEDFVSFLTDSDESDWSDYELLLD